MKTCSILGISRAKAKSCLEQKVHWGAAAVRGPEPLFVMQSCEPHHLLASSPKRLRIYLPGFSNLGLLLSLPKVSTVV